MYGATYRKRVRRVWLGPGRNTVLSPLSIFKGQKRIPDAYVQKDVCSPREVSHVPIEKSRATEFRLRIGQLVSISWEKSAEGIVGQ